MGQVQHPKIKCQQTINMSMFLKYLQVAVADPLITLQCWSTGKIASPEIVSAVCIREKVICLQRPKLEKNKTCFYMYIHIRRFGDVFVFFGFFCHVRVVYQVRFARCSSCR